MYLDNTCIWCIMGPLFSKLLLMKRFNCECDPTPRHDAFISRSEIHTALYPPLLIFFSFFTYHSLQLLSEEDSILTFKGKVYLTYFMISICALTLVYVFWANFRQVLECVISISSILKEGERKAIAFYTNEEMKRLRRTSTLAGWYIIIEPFIVFILCLAEWLATEDIPCARRIFTVFCNHLIFFSFAFLAFIIRIYTQLYSGLNRNVLETLENSHGTLEIFDGTPQNLHESLGKEETFTRRDSTDILEEYAKFYSSVKMNVNSMMRLLSITLLICFTFLLFSAVISTSISIDLVWGHVKNLTDRKEGAVVLAHLIKGYMFGVFILKYENSLSRQVSKHTNICGENFLRLLFDFINSKYNFL